MSTRKDTVAIIEDNAAAQKLYYHILSPEGYTIIQALTGSEGLDMIKNQRPDIILLDLMMPDISGEQICTIVREDPELSHTPIIMVTAKAGVGNTVRGLELGADDYLSKPFDPDELKARIQAILRRFRKRNSEIPEQDSFAENNSTEEKKVHLFGVDWLGKRKGNHIFVATTPLCPFCSARLKKVRKKKIIFETVFWECSGCNKRIAVPDNDATDLVKMVRSELENAFLGSSH
jgi:CheY-like chemotaxis protein/ribosomal protein L37AE/L43A